MGSCAHLLRMMDSKDTFPLGLLSSMLFYQMWNKETKKVAAMGVHCLHQLEQNLPNGEAIGSSKSK